MCRAININLPAAEVVFMCKKLKAAVSAMEALPNGATIIVLVNGEGAAAMRKACRATILPERTARFPLSDARRY